MSKASTAKQIKQTPAQECLATYINKLYKTLGRARYSEEREWATAGYFDQLKQWLDEDPQTNKVRPMQRKKDQKWPQPVTNLFSKTISITANALGADVPEMLAYSDNYDARNRRAAEAAEHVIDAANRESGMELLNPTLARRTVLWGLGGVYDTIAFDNSTVEVPQLAEAQSAAPAQPAAAGSGSPADGSGVGSPEGQPQPQMGEEPQGESSPAVQAVGVETVPTARLKSFLLTPFEYLLPRDAQDPNMADWQMIIWRRPLGETKENYPDAAEYVTADDETASLAFYYLNTLRSLSYQNQKTNEAEGEYCTLKIYWSNWTSLPEDCQDEIQKEWGKQPSEVYEQQQFTKLQAAIEYGLFAVVWNDCILQWAENPWDGDSPITFFPYQKDVVSVYPKGLSVELMPLTKSLNRIDSLMLRAAMSHGTQKLLWPTSQTTPIPSGDPVEVVQWDPIGEGKVKPEYVSGTPYGPMLAQLREQVVNDFKEIGQTNTVAEGEMPGAGTAFRLAAYMGAKAEETRRTMRYLWEQAHEIRARKLVKMARKVWTEPRKIQVAGFNGQYGSMQLDVADLDGGYTLNVIQDSSKPKTMTEKLQVLQLAQQGGYVDPTDTETRDYVLGTLGLTDLSPADHLDFEKADRDLEKLKNGIQPMECPFTKWDIPLKVIANYTKTEEFESLPDLTRHGILMYAQYISDKLSVAQGAPLGVPEPPPGPPGAPPPSALAQKGGAGGQPASHVLHQVPGAQVSPSQVENAAVSEAANIVPNNPNPSA